MATVETHERRTVMRDAYDGRHDRPITDLLRELRDESTALFRQEVALAKAEMSAKASRLGRGVAMAGAGGAIAYAGLLFVLLGINYLIVWGLVEAGVGSDIAMWVAPLVLGLIVAGIGYAMYASAQKKLKETSPVPHRTVQSIEENKEWLKRKIA